MLYIIVCVYIWMYRYIEIENIFHIISVKHINLLFCILYFAVPGW